MKKQVFVYTFTNARGFHIFSCKQVINTYLKGVLLFAKTKKQAIDLIKERLPQVKKIVFMQFNNQKQDFTEKNTILL